MIKNKIFLPYIFSLGLAVFFLSGCVYITHLDEVMFMKGLDNNQKQMQAAVDKEEKLFDKLKTDIENGRLKKLAQKRRIFRIYGEATLCKPVEGQAGIKETCIYREPTGGLSAQLIFLNFDAQDKLSSSTYAVKK